MTPAEWQEAMRVAQDRHRVDGMGRTPELMMPEIDEADEAEGET